MTWIQTSHAWCLNMGVALNPVLVMNVCKIRLKLPQLKSSK